MLTRIIVRNFKKLDNVEIDLGKTVVLIGPNNSGKTSLMELFRRCLSDHPPSFSLEDFSLSVHDKFWTALILKQNDDDIGTGHRTSLISRVAD